jgi:hypothetical protein
VLRLTASDGQQSTSDEVTIHVNVPTVFSPTWQDLGSTSPPGTQSFNATTGTYTVSVGGRAFSTQTNDVGSFGAMPFVGDFEMIAKVTCNDAATSTSERVGLVIRQGTASGTAQAFIGTSFTHNIWATRTTNGGAGTVTQNPWSTGDRWVRLVRTGSSVTGFISTNGTTWTQSGTINLTLSNPVYVGIGAASGSVNNAVNGTVSNVSFVSSSANVGVLVNAGSDQTIQLPQSATLVGSSSDDGLPSNPGTHTLTWSKVSGPGSVEFSHVSSATTSASFSAVGTYSLRLIAHDSEVQTFDDILVTTTATPIQAWRDEHFSTIANPQDAANLADPDNDSIPNLLEYAFGTDPTIANVNAGPTADTIDLNGEKYLQLNITKNPNATDLIYQVEFSTDMVHWSSEGNVIITNTPTLLQVRSPANSIKKYGRAVITNP